MKTAAVQDVVEKIRKRIWNDELARRLVEKVEEYGKTKNPAADLTPQEAGLIYRDEDYGDELPLSRKRDVDIDWSNHAEYRSDLRDVNPHRVNQDIADRLKTKLVTPQHKKETFKAPGQTMVVDYNTGRNPAQADVVTVWAKQRIARELLAVAKELLADMCEQRSYLPGDVEWTMQPEKDCQCDVAETDLSDCKCRRTWASKRKRAVSGIPGGTQEEHSSGWISERCEASSNLPGDEHYMNEGVERPELTAGDDSPYRWDPKHHHRPLGGKWRRTDSGWSQLPSSAKPGPEPAVKKQVPLGYG
jgi:hypothetical protein